jgi:hypothetical protein
MRIKLEFENCTLTVVKERGDSSYDLGVYVETKDPHRSNLWFKMTEDECQMFEDVLLRLR